MKTFGCQMNFHDSSRIMELMCENGYRATAEWQKADVIILNTCTVREKAWHKAVSEAGRYCSKKDRFPEIVIALTGCVAEQEKEHLVELLPKIDLVAGPDNYLRLPQLIEQVRLTRRAQVVTGFDKGTPGDFLSISMGERQSPRPPSAFVTVMKGCSERCAYCIVPSVRGPERCRPSEDIVTEARTLANQGAKEIILLGQKVNAYSKNGVNFTDLIEKLDAISEIKRIRFTSPHPRHMTPDLIRAFGTTDKLCESLHLPVQSGSDRVLRKMGRRYTASFYREVATALREVRPNMSISTDLIVGFPGETEKDFQETLELVEDVRFSGAFSFKYSPRPGTRAFKRFEDDVSAEEKSKRLAELHEVIERTERELREGLVGQHLEVLIEGAARKEGQLTGRARNNQIVNFVLPDGVIIEQMTGRLRELKVVRALPHCLEGELQMVGCQEGNSE